MIIELANTKVSAWQQCTYEGL